MASLCAAPVRDPSSQTMLGLSAGHNALLQDEQVNSEGVVQKEQTATTEATTNAEEIPSSARANGAPINAPPSQGRDLFDVSELRTQLTLAQIGDRVTNQIWHSSTGSWLQSETEDPAISANKPQQQIARELFEILNQENDYAVLTRRAKYGLETKNKLVARLHESVDLFIMTPECTHSLCHLEALKEQLAFHYHRITQHVVSFADSRLRTLPIGGPPSHALCISTWAQCVGYELICELLDSLIKEVEQLRHDCIKEVALKAAKDFSEGASSHNASASAAASAAAAAAAALDNAGGGVSKSGGAATNGVEGGKGVGNGASRALLPSRAIKMQGESSDYGMEFSPFSDEHPSPRRRARSWGSNDLVPSPSSSSRSGGLPLTPSSPSSEARRSKRSATGHQNLLSASSVEGEEDPFSDYDDSASPSSRKRSKFRSSLPPSAREVLDNWLSSHWHDPYPTPEEKGNLAELCHITVDQVNHWFINARVRRWRPTMEKAATKAKTTGSGAFAALVKDCGNENPFSKFLGPIHVDGAPPPPLQHRPLSAASQYSSAQSAFAAVQAAGRLERHV